jgi:hypothetical protein
MTMIQWADAVSGNFEDGADWVGGVAPGAGNGVDLADPSGIDYTVSAFSSQSVRSLAGDAGPRSP